MERAESFASYLFISYFEITLFGSSSSNFKYFDSVFESLGSSEAKGTSPVSRGKIARNANTTNAKAEISGARLDPF